MSFGLCHRYDHHSPSHTGAVTKLSIVEILSLSHSALVLHLFIIQFDRMFLFTSFEFFSHFFSYSTVGTSVVHYRLFNAHIFFDRIRITNEEIYE